MIQKGATEAALSLIENERNGSIIDKSLVKSTVELYGKMGLGTNDVYEKDLEAALLDATRVHYNQKRSEWMTNSTPEYMIKAENSYKEEKARVAEYLQSSSETKILKVLDEEVLEKVETELLEKEASGCLALLQNDKSEDLQRMFRLFSRLNDDGLQPIARIVRDFFASKGNDLVKARQARIDAGEKGVKNDDPKFVRALVELHGKFLTTVREVFNGNALFQKALKDAFVDTVNADIGQHTNAELISTYADRILKSGEKLSESEAERSLEQIVQLFTYIHEKDLFAEIYRNQLAKRYVLLLMPAWPSQQQKG